MGANKAEAVRLYREGVKLDAIAAQLGVSKQRVEQIAREAREPKRRTPGERKPQRERFDYASRNARVIAAFFAGTLQRDIAAAEGLTIGAVKNIVRRWPAKRAAA